MSVTIEELMKHLSYRGCDCPPDYKADLGIFNGVCPKHGGKLLVDGKTVEEKHREIKRQFGLRD